MYLTNMDTNFACIGGYYSEMPQVYCIHAARTIVGNKKIKRQVKKLELCVAESLTKAYYTWSVLISWDSLFEVEHFIYLYGKSKSAHIIHLFIHHFYWGTGSPRSRQADRQASRKQAGRQAGWQAGRQARSFLAFLLKMMIGPHNNQRHVGKDKGQAEQDI
jgi:hypothetical protein